MKVLLYTEGEHIFSKSGLGKAIKHQMKALESQGIEYTTDLKDDYDILHLNYYGPNSYALARLAKKKGKKNGEQKFLIYSVLIPTVLHGIYDFCLMSGYQILVISFIAFVIFLYTISIKKLLLLANHNRKIVFKNKFCGYCGKVVSSEICSNCGRRQV
jgi:RsiW-degrading membrane proteinase PrsW (M82 family)